MSAWHPRVLQVREHLGRTLRDELGCKFGNYLRIRGCSRKLNANDRTLFANGVRRSVMLFEWLSPSMGVTTFLTMTRFGVSNGLRRPALMS